MAAMTSVPMTTGAAMAATGTDSLEEELGSDKAVAVEEEMGVEGAGVEDGTGVADGAGVDEGPSVTVTVA